MSSGFHDLFGQPLEADPQIALPKLALTQPPKSGPLHRVQYVIEFVGPRSVLAANASQLLAADWYQGLGRPNIYAMRPADLQWQALTASTDGSYDSLALSWDLINRDGQLSSSSASHLFQLAETFAPYIQRRAMAIPIPQDVDLTVRKLVQTRDRLDIGFELTVMSNKASFLERDLWIQCAKLGLEFSPLGSFDWKLPGHPCPLLSVTPIGQTDSFSLANVQQNLTHVGVTIGFSLPLNAAPVQAVEGSFHVAEQIRTALGGRILDDANRELDDMVKQDLLLNLKQGLGLFSREGMMAGSSEAIALFSLT